MNKNLADEGIMPPAAARSTEELEIFYRGIWYCAKDQRKSAGGCKWLLCFKDMPSLSSLRLPSPGL